MTEPDSQPPQPSWPPEEDRELLFAQYVDRLVAGENIDFNEIRAKHRAFGPELVQQLADFQSMFRSFGNDEAILEDQPDSIGRYTVQQMIGEGGFGRVYLAFDEQLRRSVAIKVPHHHLVSSLGDADAYLAEARTLAELDHPNIVSVFDAGSTEVFPCYIVSKYIEGTSLSELMKADMPTWAESVGFIATVADALHFAHKKGVVHRDVKPSNILIDAGGTAHLVDFGIALRETEYEGKHRFVGTPAYMSPEQARGEGHRVDGRSDIFSLGIVFYELLVGRIPFRGAETNELLAQVATSEPRPPRQIDESIPIELERICLKALAKRASDRYTTAHDLANDLRTAIPRLVRPQTSPAIRSVAAPQTSSTDSDRSHSDYNQSNDAHLADVVSKGLRAFDHRDADFFLDLLPGPRGRDGLPESIRFWLRALDDAESSNGSFPIGLIYGPSGCGKSSLVKAGILPRLPPATVSFYVEATTDDTVAHIRSQLQQRFPHLPAQLDLKDVLAALRRGQFLGANTRVLFVLDQFEQWLHAHKNYEDTLLVSALRQCDGHQVQCILILRDDFWMAITRFMRAVDVRLVEGWNSSAVDLFSIRHARNTLAKFGAANGDLPRDVGERSREQELFLSQAVDGLAEDGTVVCVRLALFADMMKGRPWTTETLRTLGGAKGVGVEFLDATFSSSAAAPQHRYHESAARAVLRTLLPNSGLDIKGLKRSHQKLFESSGYRNQKDFAELLKILDQDLRLISPAAGAERESNGSDTATGNVDDPRATSYYQLTHDYLVPSLRDWLTRRQKETRRGRAELRLAELSDAWNIRQEARYLPTWFEYLSVRCLTTQREWTESQRELVRRADKYFGFWGTMILLAVLALGLFGTAIRRSVVQNQQAVRRKLDIQNSETLVKALLSAPADAVPYAIANIEPLNEYSIPQLQREFENANTSSEQRFIAALALAHFGHVRCEYFVERLRDVEDEHSSNIIGVLRKSREQSASVMLAAFQNATDLDYRTRLAIALLHLGEASAAEGMLESNTGDPTERTRFIAVFPKWIAGWRDIDVLSNENATPSFRYGMCCGIAEVPPNVWDVDVKRRLAELLTGFVTRDRHAGVHSAAGLVLRRWGLCTSPTVNSKPPRLADDVEREIELRKSIGRLRERIRHWTAKNSSGDEMAASDYNVDALRQELRGKQRETDVLENTWYVNSLGITMIQARLHSHTVSASDREISVRHFQQFAKDAALTDWEGPDLEVSPTEDHPVQRVTSSHAFRFCNWLSNREGFDPYYHESATHNDSWELDEESDGYRLPQSGEWDTLSIASIETKYFMGNEDKQLFPYAVLESESAAECGSKLPNPFGLFDMYGNVWEMCNDLYTNGQRNIKGLAFSATPKSLWISTQPEGYRDPESGFRVARKHKVGFHDREPEPSASQIIARIEDQQPNTSWWSLPRQIGQLAAARRAVEPNLVSYTSIDEKLKRPLGSIAWGRGDTSSPESRLKDFLDFASNSTQANVAARQKYAEARLLQISGRVGEAASVFESLLQADSSRPEPLERAIECLRLTDPTTAFPRVTEAILRFPNAPRLWELWINIGMNDHGLDAKHLIEALDDAPTSHKELTSYKRIHWLLECLCDDRPLRIDCGSNHSRITDGEAWFHDVFFVDGHIDTLPPLNIMVEGDSTVYSTCHSFATDRGGSYRVPLPNGSYRVTLSFCEGWAVNGDRSFDVAIEKQTILEEFVPRSRGFAVGFDEQHECTVNDGLLEIDFVPRKNNADINGIQIERLDANEWQKSSASLGD